MTPRPLRDVFDSAGQARRGGNGRGGGGTSSHVRPAFSPGRQSRQACCPFCSKEHNYATLAEVDHHSWRTSLQAVGEGGGALLLHAC